MTAAERFATRPLYLQVRDTLVKRIVGGTWKPGVAIPNEIELSRELGISVGTVRKALDEMEKERLISRRQGRGTFVIDQTSKEHAIRFNNIRDRKGARIYGELEDYELTQGSASIDEAKVLQLRTDEPVLRIRGVRVHERTPYMVEEATLPRSKFPNLKKGSKIPGNLVILAHNHGILLSRIEEKVRVTSAKPDVAKALNIELGTPLLHLDTVVYAIDGKPVQWRIGKCHLREHHYSAAEN